jgi:CheY-like chemotaxis protein
VQNNPSTKRVLFVDDDPVVLLLYQKGLSQLGFEVSTANDGVVALKSLQNAKPDVVVLDLMMPRLSGAEVLKFMRGQKQFEGLPVIVLSNAYMDPLANQAADLGVHTALLKVKCTPSALAAAIHEVLEGKPLPQSPDHLLAASPQQRPPRPAITRPAPSGVTQTKPPPSAADSTGEDKPTPTAVDVTEKARQELLSNSQAISQSLRQLFEAFQNVRTDKDRELRLQDVYRRIHFVAAMAAMAEHHALAQMASALEALLFAMQEKVRNLEPSLVRTTSQGLEFLQELLNQPGGARPDTAQNKTALVVDDDKLSNRLVVSALRQAQLQARGAESAAAALGLMQENVYDLVLLDVEMPQMDGIELCKRLRALPGYERIPVIYVTLHSDFETRARTVLSGGNDLIAKPILPAELAVKVVMHLLKTQTA